MNKAMKYWYYAVEFSLIIMIGIACYYGEYTNVILLAILIEVRQICTSLKTS